MKLKNSESKDNLLNRLKRIEGQIRGIQGMVNDERDCRDILQQMTAVRSALQGCTQLFLQEYAVDCLVNLEDKSLEERQQMALELVGFLGKEAR